MADRNWRQVPEIQVAKRACQDLGATAAIVVYVNETMGTIGAASYGTTGCTAAGKWCDAAYEAVVRSMEGGS